MNLSRLTPGGVGAAILALATAGTLWCQDIVEGIAAVVGDRIVLKSDVAQLVQMRAMERRLRPDTDAHEFAQLQNQAVTTLIQQKLILEIAEEESILVEEREVNSALDQYVASLINQAGSEQEIENAFGKSLGDLKREWWPDMQEQLITQKFQQQLVQEVAVTRQEVIQFYEEYRDSLGVFPTLYRVSHILFEVSPGRASRLKARHLADSLRHRLIEGDDFATLTAQYSDDPGTASSGGELGLVNRGTLVPEFEEVAFNLSPGEISDVVKTPFGYHVLEMIERVGEKINVRHILITPQVTEADEDSVQAVALTISDSIHTAQDMVRFAARYSQDDRTRSLGGNLGWVDPSQLPWTEVGDILPTLTPGHVSAPLKAGDGLHLLFVHEIKPGGVPTLATHWPELEAIALERKKADLFRQWFDQAGSTVFIRNYLE
ncbi:MAG: peptidylprolyl isomerase [Fidelibacterota bacterium]